MKLALGTAQFGLPYGISNQNGQVSRESAKSVISIARSNGIDTIDTAISYGESEACLGEVGLDGFKVITKLPALPDSVVDIGRWTHSQMQASLQRLNAKSVHAVLLHHPQQLSGPKGKALAQAVDQLKAEGVTQKVGVSIYAPSELDGLMNNCTVDLVQAPFNLIDQRLHSSGWLQKLHDAGVEMHVRSAFLQGLLLMPATATPEKFKYWLPLFNTWHDWLRDNNTSAIHACIGFLKAYPQIDKIVVGVESTQQLKQLIQAEREPQNVSWPNIKCSDERLINPSNWDVL